MDLKQFRKDNKLTQEYLAEYLGIKKAFVSRIENGCAKFPDKHLSKLINNKEGWNTEALKETAVLTTHIENNVYSPHGNSAPVTVNSDSLRLAALEKENEMLRERAEKAEERADKYWEMIQKMMDK